MGIPQKQPLPITFAGSLDLKSDPWQVMPTSFLALNNTVFTTGGRLTKRNGFGALGTTINAPFIPNTYQQFGASLTNARKVFSYQNELLLNDAWNLFSYDQSNNGWTYKGRSAMVGLATADIAQDVNTKINMDCSIDSTTGIKIFAWENGEGAEEVQYSIQDIATGQFILNKQVFGAAANYQTPRCLSISGKSWVFAVNTNDGKIYYQEIVGQTVTGSATVLVSDLNATEQFYDIDVALGNIYLTYFTSGPAIKIDQLSSTLAVVNSITQSESATNGVSFFGDGTNIWAVYNNGSATKGFIVNSTVTATVVAPFVIDGTSTAVGVQNVTGAWSSTQGLAFVFYDNGNQFIEYNTVSYLGSVATAGTPKQFMRSVNIISKAFVLSGIPHIVAIYEESSNLQNTYFLLNIYNVTPDMGITEGAPVANIASQIAPSESGGVFAPGWMCGVHNSSGSIWELALGQKTSLGENVPVVEQVGATPTEIFFSSIGVIDCQFDFSLSNPNVQILANNAHIAGGKLAMYDAAVVVEQNFLIFPEGITAVISNTGGALGSASASTLYGIIVTYEWPDNQGNLHRSYPSNNLSPVASGINNYLFQVTATTDNILNGSTYTEGGQTFTVLGDTPIGSTEINTYGTGAPASSGTLTFATGTGQSSVAYGSFSAAAVTATFPAGVVAGKITVTIPTLRVTNKSGVVIKVYRTIGNQNTYFLENTAFGSIPNDPTVDTVSLIISTSDADVVGNLELYTTGEQPDFAPPAAAALSIFKNRVLLVPYEGGYDFLYSKQALNGFPVEFSPFFDQNVGTVAGPLTAIAGMDDKIILFKSGLSVGPSILYMVGDGPAASGANNDFNDPLPIAVDCGCVDRSSIVLTPSGLIFKSDKGIYLLDRSLQASYIGAEVEAYNQYDVLSSQLIPNTTQVRFLLSNGTLIMYDYFYSRWGTFSNPPGISDCIFQGQHTYVAHNGQVYQETPGAYVDGTVTPILMNFTTAWIKLAGLQGYQRAFFFYVLAEYLSPHQMQFQIAYDFNVNPLSSTPTIGIPSQTSIITPNASSSLENWRVFLAKQRCQAFQVSFQEIYGGTPGPALTMSGLNLIVGVKSGFRTISAAQSVG